MGGASLTMEWENIENRETLIDNRVRCIKPGLGSNFPRHSDRRSMVQDRVQDAHQLPEGIGCLFGSQVLREGPQHDGPSQNGQHECGHICEQTRGHSVLECYSHNQGTVVVVPANLRDITLIAKQLPGVRNVIADEESRVMKDRTDWKLNPEVFIQLNRQLGPLTVDLFASRLTNQLPRYFSWRPDPEAETMNAFSQQWDKIGGRAVPTHHGA